MDRLQTMNLQPEEEKLLRLRLPKPEKQTNIIDGKKEGITHQKFYKFFLPGQFQNFHHIDTAKSQIAQSDIGLVENIKINNKYYSRVKINANFINIAEQELQAIQSLQGAPLIPRVFAHA